MVGGPFPTSRKVHNNATGSHTFVAPPAWTNDDKIDRYSPGMGTHNHHITVLLSTTTTIASTSPAVARSLAVATPPAVATSTAHQVMIHGEGMDERGVSGWSKMTHNRFASIQL
jgi:hypothetical protein